MPAFWLTYKPLDRSSPRGWPASEMSAMVARFVAVPGNATPLWRIASRKAARPGDRVYLFKQGTGARGIFGVGELIDYPSLQEDPHDIEGGVTYRARIRFDLLVDPARAFLLGFEDIQDILPDSLVTTQGSGIGVPDEVAAEIERRLGSLLAPTPPIGSDQADNPTLDPDSVEDERERALRAICIRRGQPAFRAALLEAYSGQCAITGCAVLDVLEAAHIKPHLAGTTNHTSNGLLLRADLHTLFECWLLAINPDTRTVIVADALKSSSYGQFACRKLRAPKDPAQSPSKKNLERRFQTFTALHRNGSGTQGA